MRGGLLVAGADFIVEFLGTHGGAWHYNKSLWLVTGTIPIELVVLFFGSGVWLAAFHLVMHQPRTMPSLQRVLLGITLMSVGLYGLALWSGLSVNMILFTLPFGFWGLSRIERQDVAAAAVGLAALTALVDWFTETWAVGAGNYSYTKEFSIETPLTYAMLVLGFIGILEGFLARGQASSQNLGERGGGFETRQNDLENGGNGGGEQHADNAPDKTPKD